MSIVISTKKPILSVEIQRRLFSFESNFNGTVIFIAFKFKKNT